MEPFGAVPAAGKARGLRACLLCSIVQTAAEFRKSGCPNCEELLRLRGNIDKVSACTTTAFDGIISMINPEESWVARWQRTDKYVKGLYAIRVSGRIPHSVEDELRERDIIYRPRDSIQD
ncbi:transcription initiation protein spt4 [Calocera viscosa TUFC12733]|uniref:Transcription elongation factor SPT4 n=1 Tax=Calocera viscosa (strain TUFC12733) TaxID=1330018 RepID=A0A167JP32_CALVF|nr:transcription initiation protein spt4 [Calocera viscosa TUFC12733]